MFRTHPTTLESFDDAAGPALRREPVLNQVQIGIVESMRAEPGRYARGVRMIVVQDDATGEVGVAMQTPPHGALVSAAGDAVARELGRRFADAHPEARTVYGDERAAHAFAEGAAGAAARCTSRNGAFELREVLPVPEAPGRPRLAEPADAPLLQSWLDAFVDEALPAGAPKDPNGGARFAGNGRTWLWLGDRGEPVCMAGNARRVEGWWAISYVYTPPAHRGRGCATALVAHMSRWALEGGARGCTLFADLANPVSNRIYERIGYRRVGTCVTMGW
jgi:predicted GNAT family acetyltransferase